MRKRCNPNKARYWVTVAECLAKNNRGVLPADADIMQLGHNALNAYIRRYPELFSHIPQASISNRLEHWQAVARSLVEQHGAIPSTTWLLRHGNYFIRRKRAFADFPRKYEHGIIVDAKGSNTKKPSPRRVSSSRH